MRLIDIDSDEYILKLYYPFNYDTDDYEDFMVITDYDIQDLPKVDAVPVIRCKDCKYYIWEIDTCNEQHSTAHNIVHEDDYCSRAVRKGKKNESITRRNIISLY